MSIYPYMTTLSPLLLGNVVKDKVANVRVITRQYSAHSCQNITRLTQCMVARSVARQQLRSLSERLGMSELNAGAGTEAIDEQINFGFPDTDECDY